MSYITQILILGNIKWKNFLASQEPFISNEFQSKYDIQIKYDLLFDKDIQKQYNALLSNIPNLKY